MASLVISWKTMRRTGTLGFSSSSRCQAIASPSRSSSVASSSSSTSLSIFFSSVTLARLSGLTMYRGSNPFSMSTPSLAHFSFLYFAGMSAALLGRSRMWPTLASTS